MSKLVERREAAGISERQLGIQADVIQSTVHRVLAGDTALTMTHLERLCAGLGVRVSTLVRQAEQSLHSPDLTYIEETEAKVREVLQGDYTPAAKEHERDEFTSDTSTIVDA